MNYALRFEDVQLVPWRCVSFFFGFFPQAVWLTLGVLTVVVKGRGARSEVANGFRRNSRAFDVRFSW